MRDILDGKIMVHAHCYRSDEILMLIRVADEFGFKIRIFQHVLEGYKVAREIARHGAGGLHLLRLVGLQDRGLGRHPLQRRDDGRRTASASR